MCTRTKKKLGNFGAWDALVKALPWEEAGSSRQDLGALEPTAHNFREVLETDENGRRGESNPHGNGFPTTLAVFDGLEVRIALVRGMT